MPAQKEELMIRLEILETYLETGEESILHELGYMPEYRDVVNDAEVGVYGNAVKYF